MPNDRRNDVPGVALHITQRGNNRQLIFRETEDYQRFAGLLIKYSDKYGIAVHAWMFMPNHIHLLVTPAERKTTGRMMMCISGAYTRFYNNKYKRTGTLYEKRYFSALVDDDDYALTIYRYIELNPVKAGLVAHPRQWHWGSYRHNAEGLQSSFIVPHFSFLRMGRNLQECQKVYRNLVNQTDVTSAVFDALRGEIRRAQIKQSAYGSDAFRERMSTKLGYQLPTIKTDK
ncbi:transposase [Pseudidiomarina terrestris]|uniref:Transposase n=1 Tax=Pseudidiomarina terrestris TaxID=2820060 RepID=A0AAW7R209_9GAMM|nr:MULTISPECIES: transposase [unclassified Pseudidiomarina]MDN7124564.1 transposase [Pseudidiomarina sp. 1APP75-32.1]MDN7126890.1 transposase [Pseudidiomarina sp. 1APR75-33.1]MDN7129145.1 transposase [Pseudidiomarina sp. 1APR75-15]MDN7134591.1 transposase [Pseudidiomarina sp. 1ASP75-5]MDN7136739.1 transposase [Pseudidiomarina sp. 1ASP75-14]